MRARAGDRVAEPFSPLADGEPRRPPSRGFRPRWAGSGSRTRARSRSRRRRRRPPRACGAGSRRRASPGRRRRRKVSPHTCSSSCSRREQLARMADERREQLELERRQRRRPSPFTGCPLRVVDLEQAVGVRLAGRPRAGPRAGASPGRARAAPAGRTASRCSRPRRPEAAHLLELGGAGGQHRDRHVGEVADPLEQSASRRGRASTRRAGRGPAGSSRRRGERPAARSAPRSPRRPGALEQRP